MPSRQDVYQGLLRAIGGYQYLDAFESESDGWVSFDDEEPFKPVIDWVMDGKEPRVNAFHVWGVGGGRGPDFSYDYCKDRVITWDGEAEEWNVRTSEAYVIGGGRNAPSDLPRAPRYPDGG